MEGIMVPLEEYLALRGDYRVIQWCYWITLALLTISLVTLVHAALEIRKRDRTIAQLYEIKANYERALRHVRGDVDKSVENGG
jgi:hypothetical protein